MTTTKHQQCYKNFIKKIEGDELTQNDSSNLDAEEDESVVRGDVKNVIIDAIAAPLNKQKNAARTSTAYIKKVKVEVNDSKKIKSGKTVVKSAGATISSEIGYEEKVYEFDENEQEPSNSQDIDDPEYESKVIINDTTDNEKGPFTCMVCCYQTTRKFSLSRHLKSHCDERPFKCSVCERGFKTKTSLNNHRNTHLGFKPHACTSCDMAFTTSGERIRHERYRHTHIKPHKCTECDYSSVELSKLRRHIRCHTGERPYQCPQCTYASPDSFKLKRHMRTHTGEKPYECDICHARFTQSNSLKHHRLIHSVNDKPVFQCHLCPTTCGRKTDLRLHIKNLHSSDQPIPCKRCGKELPDRYSYKMHIKTHEGEKCYRCKYCPYASISERQLESHVLIHLDAKPFSCVICQTSFRQKQLLNRHVKIYHSDNYEAPPPRKKDHKCVHCNKMFAFHGNLIRHMEIHDPTSRLYEEKQQLKIGRMKRVKPDGSVVIETPSNNLNKLFENNFDFYYEETEEQQVDEEDLQTEYEEEGLNEENIQYVYEEYEADEYEEMHEVQDCEQQQNDSNVKNLLIDVKPERMQEIDISLASHNKSTINLKTEDEHESEIMVLQENDDQGFVVIEVMPDDEGDEEDQVHQVERQEIKSTTTNKNFSKELHKNPQPLISDYFGFEVNTEEDKEVEEDEDTKDVIQLLEMIEEE